jgi:hypothetical protein
MLIGGEKYGMSLLDHAAEEHTNKLLACEACVRGHRVSNCQHAGKYLTFAASSHSWWQIIDCG